MESVRHISQYDERIDREAPYRQFFNGTVSPVMDRVFNLADTLDSK